MGESQDIISSLDNPPFDINKLEELINIQREQQKILEEIKNEQKNTIDNLKLLNDYLIPTEEEIKQLQKEEKEKIEENKKLQEELELEQLEIEEEDLKEKELQQEYNAEVLQQLTMLNENISKVEFANQNTNTYLYILCFGFLLAFVMTFIYKTIKKFI